MRAASLGMPLRDRSKGGFTLVEILLAAAITIILVTILLRITTLASKTVTMSTQALTAFSSARSAFDIMTQNLSQATLNTYLDYYGDATGTSPSMRRTNSDMGGGTSATGFKPVAFGRASDLQFVVQPNQTAAWYGQEVYFQAPRAYSADATLQSTTGLLNAVGYYVMFGGNQAYEPSAIATLIGANKTTEKYRYRLMQGMEPTEKMSVFTATAVSDASGTTTDQASAWTKNIANPPIAGASVTPLADNVIALVVWPRLSVNDDATGLTLLPADYSYAYDSQSNVLPTGPTGGPFTQTLTADQLPPDVQITMVVLDEASAARMAAEMAGTPTQPPTDIENALKTPGTAKFKTADQYANDLSNLATALSAKHLNFQFFSTTVVMRESKWSNKQTN